ncbi:MAG TPA: hypothetical protein VJM69_06640 [Dehalococcoidia bacterium]|nr:hypothetical protein [Dehalococcoidia bacterium]
MMERKDEAMGPALQPQRGLRSPEEAFWGEDNFTPLQRFFLQRLMQLVTLRSSEADLDPHLRRLLDRTIFSTYLDCLDQGVGATAQAILQKVATNAASASN